MEYMIVRMDGMKVLIFVLVCFIYMTIKSRDIYSAGTESCYLSININLSELSGANYVKDRNLFFLLLDKLIQNWPKVILLFSLNDRFP